MVRGFGDRVRSERKRLKLSQEQLAHISGLDRTYVSGVERGERNVGLRNASLLATSLGVSLADLVSATRPTPANVEFKLGTPLAYRVNRTFNLSCGFEVDADAVQRAALATNAVMSALPMTLFTTIDLKSQSGIVGAVFAAELAGRVGAIPNPIEKGHPDIVPLAARDATEESLRNYGAGLEIKSTLGGVLKGSGLGAGESRVEQLTNITWQAHHRDVRALMGLVWDYPQGRKSALAHPAISAVFFSDGLVADDWGAISGTTGRNTKVTGMLKSGHRKMAAGAVLVLDDDDYVDKYARSLGRSLTHLTQPDDLPAESE